jgi:hypothetical protein
MTDFAHVTKWLAVCLSMAMVACGPAVALGANSEGVFAQPPVAADIALDADGVFRGQILDSTGKPVAGDHVSLYHSGHFIAQTRTDAEGRFAVSGVRSGIHQVEWKTAGGASVSAVFRLWHDGTAPPNARSSVLMISGDDIARGQHAPGKVWCFLSNPWVTAGLITAAIALPIALTNDSDSAS